MKYAIATRDGSMLLEVEALTLREAVEGGRADLSNADLRNADLSRADLRDADLSNADLSNADLSRADLRNADLSRVIFCNCNLQGARISHRGGEKIVQFIDPPA